MAKKGGFFLIGILILLILFVLGLIVFLVINYDKDTSVKPIEPVETTTTTIQPVTPPVVEDPIIKEPEFQALDEDTKEDILDIRAIDESSDETDCESVELKEQCYFKLALETKDFSLCEKLTFERYKTICVETLG
ncbi:hypothetical protein CL622_03300 [archaeon]|nr:hypothetical protein [archaeon]|tara:strand:- start:483 stop:887 length:405 start_codon:yes stop_codon:yes gene_type:complete